VFWHALLCVNCLFHCNLLSVTAPYDAATNWKDKATLSQVHFSSSDDDDDDEDYDSDAVVDERNKIYDPYDPLA
jgi:hypothetical protein